MPAKMAQISPLGRRAGCQDYGPSAPPGGLVKTRQQRKNPPRFGVHLGNPGSDDYYDQGAFKQLSDGIE